MSEDRLRWFGYIMRRGYSKAEGVAMYGNESRKKDRRRNTKKR